MFLQILLIINALVVGLIWLFLLIAGIMLITDKQALGLLNFVLAFGFWKLLKFISSLMYPDDPKEYSANYKLAWAIIIFGCLAMITGFVMSYLGWAINESYFPETTTIKELYVGLVISVFTGIPFLGTGLFLLRKEPVK